MQQLKAKNYAAKYAGEKLLLGVEFSKERRQIVGWQVKRRAAA